MILGTAPLGTLPLGTTAEGGAEPPSFTAPEDLVGTPTSSSIQWSWSASPTAVGYEIEAGPVGGPYTYVDVGPSLSYEQTNLVGMTQYEARVRAYR